MTIEMVFCGKWCNVRFGHIWDRAEPFAGPTRIDVFKTFWNSHVWHTLFTQGYKHVSHCSGRFGKDAAKASFPIGCRDLFRGSMLGRGGRVRTSCKGPTFLSRFWKGTCTEAELSTWKGLFPFGGLLVLVPSIPRPSRASMSTGLA